MDGIPPAKSTDVEDVVWALQTADALWKRNERVDAVVWLRRAAQAAGDAEDDERAVALARNAAELTEFLASSPTPAPGRSSSVPPGSDKDRTDSQIDDLLRASATGFVAELVERRASSPHAAPTEPDSVETLVPTASPVRTAPPPVVRPTVPTVPTADKVHAGMLDPWSEGSASPAARRSSAPPAFDAVDDEVITSARLIVPSSSSFRAAEPLANERRPSTASSASGASIHHVESRPGGTFAVASSAAPTPVVPAVSPAAISAAPSNSPKKPPPLPASAPRPAAGSRVPRPPPPSPSPSPSPPPPPSRPTPVVSPPSASLRVAAASAGFPVEDLQPVASVDLNGVEAFADLPDDARDAFALAAKVIDLALDEEVGQFALAYVIDGEIDASATTVDAPAARFAAGSVLRNRNSIDDQLPLRLICASDAATVALWNEADVDAAFRTCPWVEDDLRAASDRAQALAGVTVGALGERLDRALRDSVVSRLDLKVLMPGEIIVDKGRPVPGLVIVGVGHLELVEGDAVTQTLRSGEFLFADAVLQGGPAPLTARAGKSGALLMMGSRHVAQELLVTCPPLLELFAGM
jgi:hypothetical protein